MSSNGAYSLHNALLRPAILHILRAAGFHSARPSVVDTLADITVRYLFLLASNTASHAYTNHNDYTPDITDVRMAMQDCGVFAPTLTAAEEAWREILRKPLDEYPEHNGLRANERARRDAEDTREVTEFVEWFRGERYEEIKRIAGLIGGAGQGAEIEAKGEPEDYLTVLKKKHSKTGEESRFQGTVLGKPADYRPIKIEGGSAESIEAWIHQVSRRSAKLDAIAEGNGYVAHRIEEDADTSGTIDAGTVEEHEVTSDG